MNKPAHTNVWNYTLGFALCVGLTVAAFLLTSRFGHGGWLLLLALFALAFMQIAVQLRFFIHLPSSGKPDWNKLIFAFMSVIIFIVVGGSLWIMKNLNYHMAPMQSDKAMIHDEGVR